MPSYSVVAGRPPAVDAPLLDQSQQAVVDHPGGPLLVLAGPGTGKTTTLVEAVVERVDRRGLRPDQVLVLTFSRKAAEELRDRITLRLGRTTTTPPSSTFHAFCYSLVRRYQPEQAFEAPLRVLSAAEQDVRLRELLAGSRRSGLVRWPPGLDAALRTRGFAAEVRAVLSRTRELGLESADLKAVGRAAGRAEWTAVGSFFDEYLDVLDAEGVIDYAELIHRAVLLAERDDVRRDLRRMFAAVFVDEYQDSDPAQVRLLQAIAGDGRDLVVTGDPDQSIYAFRGADVRGIMRFPQEFRSRSDACADVIALGVTRRFGERLLTASRRIAAGLAIPGTIDHSAFAVFRGPTAGANPHGPGRVDALTFSSTGAELDHIGDILRRAHLEDGVAWSQMAVLVRSGLRSIPGLRRALVAAGVPVEVAGDDLPLKQEPAVGPLLAALRACADPSSLTADGAAALLVSPLGGLDAAELRRLGRQLRDQERASAAGQGLPRPSAELVRDALADPSVLEVLPGTPGRSSSCARRAHDLASLLAHGRELVAGAAAAQDVLWALWSGTPWPLRLRAAVEGGGPAARFAHRDLDAVCALFDQAARAEQRSGHAGVLNFLEQIDAQQIPAGSLAEQGVRGGAVRLLTAHRAKGLEWQLVVVAGVQEGVWPDLRHRGSLLQPDRLGGTGLVPPLPASALLAEERRLFYVAVTRARQRLVVTAVASSEPDGDQPSRFLDALGVRVRAIAGRPSRPLTLAGLIGELRRVCSDDGESPQLRRLAAARLARLADQTDHEGRPLISQADPETWWGGRPETVAAVPVRPPGEPLVLSGSAVSALVECPLSWFLSREASGESARSTSLGFGNVIHAIAEQVGTGALPADAEELVHCLEAVWGRLQFDAPWVSAREGLDAEAVVTRFLAWHTAPRERELLGCEIEFTVEVDLGHDRAILKGAIDRVERDAGGRVVVVDLKTGKKALPANRLAEHPQLGLYQLAVRNGAVADLAGPQAPPGGAELVQLRVDDSGRPRVQRQGPLPVHESGRTVAELQLQSAADAVRAEAFPARPGTACAYCEFKPLCPAQSQPIRGVR